MNALIIANTQIRCDSAGRFCLNDLHQASGGEKRHQPANWLRLDQVRELIEELGKRPECEEGILRCEEAPVHTVNDGFGNGTYAAKELIYAYAMWISAKFHLHVIRAYDALVQHREPARPPLAAQPQHRADQLVSAGRVFAAAFRTARAARVPYPQAVHAATACAQRHTGIDWREELGGCVQIAPVMPTQSELRQDTIARFHAALMAGNIAGLMPCIGLTTDWYAAYVRWCTEAETYAAAMPKFVNAMERQQGVEQKRTRWGRGAPVSTFPVNSFLLLGGRVGYGSSIDPAWLADRKAECRAMIDRYLASAMQAEALTA